MMQQVIAAADISEADIQVLRRASAIAQENAARLTILHVVEHADLKLPTSLAQEPPNRDDVLKDAHSRLGALVTKHCYDAPSVFLRIEAGAPHDGILSVAEQIGADLVVLGANQRQTLRDKILGSTADRVVRRASAPVLVVRRHCTGPYHKVTAAIDLDSGADHVVNTAWGFSRSGRLRLVHVVDLPLPFEQALLRSGLGAAGLSRHREALVREARERLEELARRETGLPSARTEVIVGEAATSIIKLSRGRTVDLLVIGREKRGAVERVMLGSVALRLLYDASCDVLVASRSPN